MGISTIINSMQEIINKSGITAIFKYCTKSFKEISQLVMYNPKTTSKWNPKSEEALWYVK